MTGWRHVDGDPCEGVAAPGYTQQLRQCGCTTPTPDPASPCGYDHKRCTCGLRVETHEPAVLHADPMERRIVALERKVSALVKLLEGAAKWRDDGTMTSNEFAAVMAVLYVRDVRAASPEAQERLLAVADSLVCAFPGCGDMVDGGRHRYLVQECMHDHRLDCHPFTVARP